MGGRRSSAAVWSGSEKGPGLLGPHLAFRAKLEEPETPRVFPLWRALSGLFFLGPRERLECDSSAHCAPARATAPTAPKGPAQSSFIVRITTNSFGVFVLFWRGEYAVQRFLDTLCTFEICGRGIKLADLQYQRGKLEASLVQAG